MIRPDVMQAFVDAFADAGFNARSFLPSYGLAEATLAVSIMPPGEGIVVELVEETLLAGGGTARRDGPQRYRANIHCRTNGNASCRERGCQEGLSAVEAVS